MLPACVEPITPAVGFSGLPSPCPIADISEAVGRPQPNGVAGNLPAVTIQRLVVEEAIVHGDAARRDSARGGRQREVDLIVVSSHGRTGLGRMIFGSTAEAWCVTRGSPFWS